MFSPYFNIKTSRKQRLRLWPWKLQTSQTVNVSVSWHPHPAVLIASLCVQNLYVCFFELFSVLEQFRCDCWIDYRRLKNSGQNHIRSHSLGDPSHQLISLDSIVILALTFSIRILSIFVFLLLLATLRILFLLLELFFEFFDNLNLFFICLS